jgi:hypothetical protein
MLEDLDKTREKKNSSFYAEFTDDKPVASK